MMIKEIFRSLLPRLASMPGEVSLYVKDLVTGESCAWQADLPLVAASVIKIPILIIVYTSTKSSSMILYYGIHSPNKQLLIVVNCGTI